ncbi:MAG: hypothetical protein ACM3JG_05745, partial [Thiohalocapsa sp.]
ALEEIRRVLKPGGLLAAEIVRGSKDEDGREPGPYEAVWWDALDAVVRRVEASGLPLSERKRFSDPWQGDQCIFRKPAPQPPIGIIRRLALTLPRLASR